MELLERFSPKDHYYLFMGHSPGKLASFMEALSPDLSQTFPASGLGGAHQTYQVAQVYSAYRRHFKALLPASVVKGTRKILLVDYTNGTSSNNFRHGLRRFLRDIHSSVQVETAGWAAPRHPLSASSTPCKRGSPRSCP